ncbi:6-hydroxy-D-nicotine oxidase [Aspergillus sclerotioniger CBS 115572]|uniref:6-hydroxy-D-nicotine oxidase n=1 Tax=Aspergillus sclerotioniger CBS 115572 TaxID=1450535 RepID=A0A317VC51_9EURO|nr:6-hydroxy-D-nicotine oxidase [Aspergillus sclerotioniger CBS 115572]PWY71806.1 6-hydroxy-D-nicotine oxidase [Aspergillus sclerotioniger CBS 115572]
MASNTTTALTQLQTLLPDKTLTPSTSTPYQAALTTPWSQTCWTPAAGYIQISTIDDLTTALSIIQKTGCKFSVRTTGHNPNVGFSSADETAIVLDIRQLKTMELTPDGTARVGAGCTWGEVYTWLEGQKLSAIGGRDPQVGLGGFLLGGGMGALPNLHGLGADNVKNFEVLLANGTLLNANPTTNPDLYHVLKGGGSNFGIITHFTIQTYPLIPIQYNITLYQPTDHTAINEATVSVQNAMASDPKIGLFTNFNNGFVAVGLLYSHQPSPASTSNSLPVVFDPFQKVKSMMTAVPLTNGTILSLAQAMGHAQEAKKRAISTVTTRVSVALYEEVYKVWNEVKETLPEGCILHYTIQPMGENGVREGMHRGGNIMGLKGVEQCWWVFTCEWPNECDDIAAQQAVETMSERVQTLAQERDLLLDFKCMTFATGLQKVLESYGEDNVKKMKEVAGKYDPEGVFQKLQFGGFLLRDL